MYSEEEFRTYLSLSESFIAENLKTGIADLALKKTPENIPKSFVLNQVNGIQRALVKWPNIAKLSNFIYPSQLNLEQSSSEITAEYKAKLVKGNIVDCTGGLGIDSIYFARNSANHVIHIEQNEALQKLAKFNFQTLGLPIVSYCANGMEWLSSIHQQTDWIYLDPSRRDGQKQKIYKLEDMQPNVLENLTQLMLKSKNILLKAAPLVDIKRAIEQLKYVANVYVISVENDCKEVLFHLNQIQKTPLIHAINLNKEPSVPFQFTFEEEHAIQTTFNYPQSYIYEPNTSILKSGGFKSIANTYSLLKLHPNTHLYTSEKLVTSFPGRIFKLDQGIKVDANLLKSALPNLKANLSIRNFPMEITALKKKLHLKDGGDVYIFACTIKDNQKQLLLCQKL